MHPLDANIYLLAFQMASAPMSTVLCDECLENLEVKFHCETCGKSLCSKCKVTHSKNKATRRHVIVRNAKKSNPKYLADLLCNTHNTKDPELWCNTCGVPICIPCSTEKHIGHYFSRITTTILSEKRDAILEEINIVRDNAVGHWEEQLIQAKKITLSYIEEVDKIDKDLVSRAEAIHKEVDRILLQARQTLNQMTKPCIDKLKEQEQYMTDKIKQMKFDVQQYEDKLRGLGPNDLLQFKPGSLQLKDTAPSLKKASVPVFSEGTNAPEFIQEIFGQLSTDEFAENKSSEDTEKSFAKLGISLSVTKSLVPNPPVQTEFDISFHNPCIACVDGGLAWINCYPKMLQLVDRNGMVKDTINIGVSIEDIAVTSDGALLFADYLNSCIKSMSTKKTISTLFKTSMWPTGLCCLLNGDIVVTFEYDGAVTVFSKRGEIRWTRDFKFPVKVTVNKVNQDICICHTITLSRKMGKLTALRTDGQLRIHYEYEGQFDKYNKRFDPRDVCTDQMGYVLIADDFINNRIHILDQEGQFIQYLLTSDQDIWTIDVDKEGYIWVGGGLVYKEGNVKVHKYLC